MPDAEDGNSTNALPGVDATVFRTGRNSDGPDPECCIRLRRRQEVKVASKGVVEVDRAGHRPIAVRRDKTRPPASHRIQLPKEHGVPAGHGVVGGVVWLLLIRSDIQVQQGRLHREMLESPIRSRDGQDWQGRLDNVSSIGASCCCNGNRRQRGRGACVEEAENGRLFKMVY